MALTYESAKYSREEDMVNRVHAVFDAAAGKLPLMVFDGKHMEAYIAQLDNKHSPPHRLERIRLLEVMADAALLEFSKIVAVS